MCPQAGIFPWSRPMPHNHMSIGQGGVLDWTSVAIGNKPFRDLREFGAVEGGGDASVGIAAAFASGEHIFIPEGIWGHTGGLSLAIRGQQIRGAGREATTLLKLNGVSDGLTIETNNFIGISDLTLDQNNLGGIALKITSDYALLKKLRIEGQGGADYALEFNDSNSCEVNDVFFADGNYGHLKIINSSYYIDFYSLKCGSPGPGGTLYIDSSSFMNFYDLVADNNENGRIINLNSNCEGINFYGLLAESTFIAAPLILIGANTCININFNGGRILQSAATAQPIFDIIGAYNVQIDGFFLKKPTSDVTALIKLDNTRYIKLSNIIDHSSVAHEFLKCFNAPQRIALINCNYKGGTGAGTCNWGGNDISVLSSNLLHAFQPGSSNIVFSNVSGNINLANSDSVKLIKCTGAITGRNLTINGGVVTITTDYHLIDTEGAAASDDLDTINGGVDGQFLMIACVNAARSVVVKHNTGNIIIQDSGDIILNSVDEKLLLFYDGTNAKWNATKFVGA